jgi:hypothetical protein
MPVLPPYPPLNPRSSLANPPKHPNTKVVIIISSIVELIFFLLTIALLYLWFQIKAPQWYRNLRAAKAARKQAIADQKAWYASTRPVVRRPYTPRLLDVYTREPHIQRPATRDGGGSVISPVTGAADTATVTAFVPTFDEAAWFGGSRSNTTASGAPHVSTPGPIPSLQTYLDYRPSTDADGDIGLEAFSIRDSHQTTGTIGTVQSNGVAVPISLPKSSSASEVHHSLNSWQDQGDRGSVGVAVPVTLLPPLSPKQVWITSRDHEVGHDETFVVGDEEDA